MYIVKGDIFCYNSKSSIGKIIKWAEQGYSEAPSIVAHTGIFVDDGELTEVNVIEALFPKGVVERPFWENYKDTLDRVYVLKPKNICKNKRDIIVNYCKNQVGKPYGTLKLLPHLADGVIAKVLHKRDVRFFRKLIGKNNFPICSFLVANAYAQVGLDFGITSNMATPDDILDFALSHPQKYSVTKL